MRQTEIDPENRVVPASVIADLYEAMRDIERALNEPPFYEDVRFDEFGVPVADENGAIYAEDIVQDTGARIYRLLRMNRLLKEGRF